MLITKTKITSSVVSSEIIRNFPFSKRITQNDDVELFIGKFPHEAYIIFDESKSINDKLCLLEDSDKANIPFGEAQFNFISFNSKEVAQNIVSTIAKFYPELVVYDESINKIITAEQYLKN